MKQRSNHVGLWIAALAGVLGFLASLHTMSPLVTALYTAPYIGIVIEAQSKNAPNRQILTALAGATVPITILHCIFIVYNDPEALGGANIGLGFVFLASVPLVAMSTMASWLLSAERSTE